MENATKALLIGASILIAILLISVGMRVFNSGANASKSTGTVMGATEKTTFNAQFTSFQGTQKKNKISDLVQKVIASNATSKQHKVTINLLEPENYPLPTTDQFISFDYNDGYIINININ